MIITFLPVNGLLFCFLLSMYQWKKKIVHSHIQEMARKHTWQFLSKLSASSLYLKTGLRTFLSEWGHSCSHILFVLWSNIWWRNSQCRILRSVNHYHRHPVWPSWPKQAKRFGKGRKTRKTRKDREVKVTDANIENVENGRHVWKNLTGYRAVAIRYLKPDTAIRFVSASLGFLRWSITIYKVM